MRYASPPPAYRAPKLANPPKLNAEKKRLRTLASMKQKLAVAINQAQNEFE